MRRSAYLFDMEILGCAESLNLILQNLRPDYGFRVLSS